MSFGKFAGKMFRIGHQKGGVQAAMDYLVSAHGRSARAAAE